MDPSLNEEAQSPKISAKAEALKQFSSSVKPPSFSSSISKLSGSSRGIPSNKDFHFYFNFEEFKTPIQEMAKHSQSILETIGSSAEQLWGKKQMKFPNGDIDDDDEAYDWLVNINDELFERFDSSLDEFKKIRNKQEETGVRVKNLVDDDGFQLVQGRKKKDSLVNNGNTSNSPDNNLGNASSVKVVSRDSNAKAKVSFHIPSIRRPQDEYKILVNNANQPFEHVWLQRSEDGSKLIHPLENLSIMDFIDKTVSDEEPVKPPPVESTSFKMIQEVKDLKKLAAALREADEFAVDLEHNQYRSFQGLTCLMQISTRTEDFIVDTLKLRVHIGPYLRDVFKDPTKRKVMHGADRDIIWLQRDFGIYVCNMFDTGQASKVLKLERNSLEFLLRHFCEVSANKEYQNADWRLRPLTDEMLRYASEDTHYLLYIYDVMKRMLLSSSTDPNCPEAPLIEVYQRSYDVCMQLYQKELLTENSYLNIYGLHAADLNGQQLAIVAGLVEWRDVIARAEDESTGFILPNKSLIEIAKQMPVTSSKLRHVMKSKHPYIERNLGSVVGIIRHSMQNAAAFEPVAKRLKEEYIEIIAARNARNADAQEAAEVAASENVSNVAEGDSFEKEVGNFIQNNKSDGFSGSKVSIEVQKKPSRAFGSMFGNASGKRKLNPESKATEEIKVEQIKSSVSLPFHSFTEKPESSSISIIKEISTVEKLPEVSPATTTSKPESDVILLESDSGAEEEPETAPESTATNEEKKMEDENKVIMLDSDSGSEEGDEDEGNVSLADLSTSFQKLNQGGGEGSSGPVKVTPFDYEAARKEAGFGGGGGGGGGGGHMGMDNSKGLLQWVQSITFVSVSVDHSLQLVYQADSSPGTTQGSGIMGQSTYTEGFTPVKSLGSTSASYIFIPSPTMRFLPPNPLQLPTCLTSESPPLAHLLHSKGSAIPIATGFVVSKAVPSMRKDSRTNSKEEWPSVLSVALFDYYGSNNNNNNNNSNSNNNEKGSKNMGKSMENHLILDRVAAELHALSWMTVSPGYLERRTSLPFHCDMVLRLRRLLHFADKQLSQISVKSEV